MSNKNLDIQNPPEPASSGGFDTPQQGGGAQIGRELTELLEMVGFEAEDADRLRAALPHLRPHLPGVAERFYGNILSAPLARAVLRSEAQVERLKGSLVRWIEETLAGPHDAEFFAHQRRIGQVHVVHGVPPRYVFTTMAALREDLRGLLAEELGDADASRFAVSFDRVTCVGLATVIDTYIETREERELDTLQGVLVSNMPATVLLIDAEGLVTSAAASDTRLFEGDDSVRRGYLDVLPPSLLEASRLQTHVERALATEHELALPRVDVEEEGGVRSFRVSIVPLDHPRARVLIHIADLTDVIQAESRARRSETLAQLGAFSAAVAHELRNPLAGISGALQVISKSLDEDDRRKSIMEKIDGQIRRLDTMVSDLLALAKPAEPVLIQTDLRSQALSAIEMLGREHPRAQVHVEGSGSALADPALIDQILLNLLQNAATATGGDGEIRVDVSDGMVRVSDDGAGVPEDRKRKIFEPFFTTRTRGTGLGLAICRRAAESMGAELVLADGPLKGASFVLYWPS